MAEETKELKGWLLNVDLRNQRGDTVIHGSLWSRDLDELTDMAKRMISKGTITSFSLRESITKPSREECTIKAGQIVWDATLMREQEYR